MKEKRREERGEWRANEERKGEKNGVVIVVGEGAKKIGELVEANPGVGIDVPVSKGLLMENLMKEKRRGKRGEQEDENF